MDKIADMTECLICSNLFTDPRQLPCIHTFCLRCLDDTSQNGGLKPGDSMHCPFCKELFPIPPEGMTGLPKNTFISRMTETARTLKPCQICVEEHCKVGAANRPTPNATQHCFTCHKNICDQCSRMHKELQDHRIVTLRSSSEFEEDLLLKADIQYCDQHSDEVVRLYCRDCRQVICQRCASEEHETHELGDIETVADEFREDLAKGLGQLNACSKQAAERIGKIVDEQSVFHRKVEAAEEAAIRRGNELKDIVDQCTRFLLNELESYRQQELNPTEN